MQKLSLLLFSLSMGFASDLSFTQNNPPHQDEVKRNHPVIFTGDMLWGKAVLNIPTEQWLFQFTEIVFFNPLATVNNGSKLGFMTSIGVAINKTFNLAFHYRYLRSGSRSGINFILQPMNENTVLMNQLRLQSGQNNTNAVAVIGENNFKNRLNILDIVVQTSTWMLSNLRFQPFAGIRYLHQKITSNSQASSTNNFEGVIANATGNGTLFKVNERFTFSNIGVIFGTDVKYLISKNWFLFTTLLSQIDYNLSNKYLTSYIIPTNTTNLRSDNSFLGLVQSWEEKFGIGWEQVFGDDWLLSLRLFLETHENLFADYGFGFTLLF